MKKYSWTDGWHDINDYLSIFIENGKIVRGMRRSSVALNDWVTVYPYRPNSREGGLDRVYDGVPSNKRSFEMTTFR